MLCGTIKDSRHEAGAQVGPNTPDSGRGRPLYGPGPGVQTDWYTSWPEVARAVAEPILNVKDITIIDTEGANKLTRVTANTVSQLDSILESSTGSSLSALVTRHLGNGSPQVVQNGDAPQEKESGKPPK